MRRLAFAMAVVALGGAFLLVGLRPGPASPSATPVPRSAASRAPSAAARPAAAAAVRPEARRFVTAFLSYEVGAGGAAALAAVRAGASAAFGYRLLSESPAVAGPAKPAAARLTSLHVERLQGDPDLDLVSGEANRPGGSEPFAFLFVRRAGRWLAAAPAE